LYKNKFLEEFNNITNTSNGIKELRTLILHLAITGKLIDKYSNENSEELYNRIIKGNHVKMDATSFIESYGAMCHYIEHSFFKGALTSKKGILEHWRNSSPADNRRDMNIDVYFK
jgi:hypothetical protein